MGSPVDAASVASTVERVVRTSYGRLLAILAAPTGDIAAAEDALSDAVERALETWPTGIPTNPEGWLYTVARNRLRDGYRASASRTLPLTETVHSEKEDSVVLDAIPDKRLALLFTCAHPAIDPGIRTPLMLQTVLGFDAEQVARAFAVPTAVMAQRLVRAKRRIKLARIPFSVPDRSEIPVRLAAVLEAIYGAFAIDRTHDEALFLAVLLVELLDDPEVLGLAALLSLSMAREGARPAPIDEQDPKRWNPVLIAQGERFLRRAHDHGTVGRFQLEAAMQSVYCARATTGVIDYAALRGLHAALVRLAPTLGALVAQAAVVGEVDGPTAGLALLDRLDAPAFQPAWATRAHLYAVAGQTDAAIEAYDEAIRLSPDAVDRQQLRTRRAALG